MQEKNTYWLYWDRGGDILSFYSLLLYFRSQDMIHDTAKAFLNSVILNRTVHLTFVLVGG
jgi:hypothetical protein